MALMGKPSSLKGQRIKFNGSPKHTIGVELELSLIDRETRGLTPVAPKIFEVFPDHMHIKQELFQTIVEVTTGICDTVDDARKDLTGTIEQLRAVVDPLGVGLMCTGTHPFSHWSELPVTDKVRYQNLVHGMAWPARRLLICGQHVHVGVPSGEHAIALMNSLSSFIPHLLALSASSPYWLGLETGLASCRTKIFEGLPTAGLSPEVKNWNEFVTLMRTLLNAEAINSIQEIWWDIRPHPTFGTVEIRIFDGINTMDEVCALTAMVQSLVAYLCELYDAGEDLPRLRGWTIRENKWRAARHGDEALLVRNEQGDQATCTELLAETLEEIEPFAEKLGCKDDLANIANILVNRPSFHRQRKRVQAVGSLEGLVDGLLEEFETGEPMIS